MLPASKGSPAEVSPSLPETGSVPFVSLFMVSVPALAFSLVVVEVAVLSLLLLLSPQMALAAVLAIEFIVSIVGQLMAMWVAKGVVAE